MLAIQNQIHASDDDLMLYIEGRLGSERVSALDPHLMACDLCSERFSRSIGSSLLLDLIANPKPGIPGHRGERSESRFRSGSDAMAQSFSPLSLDRENVKIVDISKNGLGILSSKAALPGTIMQIRINTDVELGEVRHCSKCDEGFRIGLRFVAVSKGRAEHFVARSEAPAGDLRFPLEQPDRRQVAREPLSQFAVVSALETGRVLEGEIRNVAEGGTQVLLHEALRVRSLVKIEYADKLLLGEVVYCQQEPEGWLLGIHVGHVLCAGVTESAEAMYAS